MKTEEVIEQLGNILRGSITNAIDETLPELLKQLDVSESTLESKNQIIATLEARLAEADDKIATLELAKAKAEESAKEKSWLANELGKFVSDVANGIYEGQEMAAARRIYDLNSGSLNKRRINACNYESLADAEKAFAFMRGREQYTSQDLLQWLFELSQKA